MPENEWETPFWERGGGAPATDAPREVSSSSVEAVPAQGQLRTNLAVVGASDALFREMDNNAADYGFRLVPRSELRDAVANTPACQDTTTEACAEALAAYPGARLVITVNNDDSVTVVDAASGARWTEAALTSGKRGDELLDMASQRSDIAPWAMKAFQADDGRLYLSAGRANGLEAGDELAVHEPGTLVRAPNGQPITWRVGERVGTVRVAELFGSDLASLTPVEGQRLSPQHDLILVED
ncbi:hypothetical protein ACJO2E_18395 [Marinobacter sp. M1N3S26]|uniref:hypothetical protein n=1 Tax=Marinobacter sp. M1N3S26 TaxID=3382299 RepID=UPI00387A9780